MSGTWSSAWSRPAPRGRCRCRRAGARTLSCPAGREPRLGLGLAYRSFPDVLPALGAVAASGGGHCMESRMRPQTRPSLLQIVISLDDFAQLVLGPFVPPVGVGVVTLHQLLEPGLDLVAVGARSSNRALPAICAPAASRVRRRLRRSGGSARGRNRADRRSGEGRSPRPAPSGAACRGPAIVPVFQVGR